MDVEKIIPFSQSSESPDERNFAPSLPIEILLYIFSFVDIKTRISILKLSKEIRDVCLTNLWKPWGNKAYGLKRAIYRGHIGYFRRWRKRMPKEEDWVFVRNNFEVSPLVIAAEKGYLDFIKMFLRDPLYQAGGPFDPFISNEQTSFVDIWLAFRRACAMQRTNVIRFFLNYVNFENDGRPSEPKLSSFNFIGDDVLIYACKNGHDKTVKVLLEDDRFDPSALDSYCLRKACKYGHLKVVELLLNNGRADPNSGNGECIYYAAERNYTEIYEALTLDWRMQILSEEDDTSTKNLDSDDCCSDSDELGFY